MSDLIKRDAVIDALLLEFPQINIPLVQIALERISAVDAVEVVRCKDCEFCRYSFDPWTKTSVQVCGYVGFNPVQSSQVSDNDFCSSGERRDDNAVD